MCTCRTASRVRSVRRLDKRWQPPGAEKSSSRLAALIQREKERTMRKAGKK